MALREDWKCRLWQNKAWVCRACIAFVLMLPLLLIEYVLQMVESSIQWAYEKSGALFDAWNESNFVARRIKWMQRWVGKMESSNEHD